LDADKSSAAESRSVHRSEDPTDERKALELGADLFQKKTFEPPALDRFLHFLEKLGCSKVDGEN
jgi:hypothetical protein